LWVARSAAAQLSFPAPTAGPAAAVAEPVLPGKGQANPLGTGQ